MVAELKQMSGEELLLVSVLGGSKVQDLVDRELDRRALEGGPRKLRERYFCFGPDPRRAA